MSVMTLSDGSVTINLPGDMLWDDHFGWSPVVQQVGYTLSGALVVESAVKQSGRPITLRSGENFALVKKASVDHLQSWAGVAGKLLTLNAHGENLTVLLRHEDAPAVEAFAMLAGKNPLEADDWMSVVVKLLQI